MLILFTGISLAVYVDGDDSTRAPRRTSRGCHLRYGLGAGFGAGSIGLWGDYSAPSSWDQGPDTAPAERAAHSPYLWRRKQKLFA